MLTLESFNAFVASLARHDWYYDFSDDHSVWNAGRNSMMAIASTSRLDPICQAALDAWRAYIDKKPRTLHSVGDRDREIQRLRDQVIAQSIPHAA